MPLRRLLICLLLLLTGCPTQEKPLPPLVPSEPAGVVRLLIVNDPPLAAAIEREWTARTGEEIEVRQIGEGEFLQTADWQADAVIYPPGLLGELAERKRIVPFPAETLSNEAFDRRGLLPLVRQFEMRWGEETYAVALAAPRLALLYRADLFEKLSLPAPSDWESYLKAAEALHNRENLGELAPAADRPWSGAAEPLAGDWASEMVLARAAGSVVRQGELSTLFDFGAMQALIDSPPYVAALENMRVAAAFQAEDRLSIDPAEARKRILAGECGMAITWLPVSYDPGQNAAAAADPLPLAVAPLPGSSQVYDPEAKQWAPRVAGRQAVPLVGFGGRIASVAADSPRKRDAFDLLLLLAGPQWSHDVARRSAQAHPFRRQHVENLRAWLPAEANAAVAEQYAGYLDQLELSQLVLVSPRIPGRTRYLAALNAAAEKVVGGETSAEAAATEAAAAWNAITEELGPESQRRAYRQSAGIGF